MTPEKSWIAPLPITDLKLPPRPGIKRKPCPGCEKPGCGPDLERP